ncbi:ROK family protein [Quadrisphaera sp. DSM 44207]|uniref:ROK family protein n=1 Tax=Quadrisphaera sp. DSM 44207 TaxID=1881057 RepID=UPI0008859D02|nr:ROK family protein [Quadrisphaera sp. DSM 44207]SDQ08277.1 Sugar kinase of the NBD/HSP70 family, may contain an N-terminal HTH domain [Quadrisphaera sp. DSM 44207]
MGQRHVRVAAVDLGHTVLAEQEQVLPQETAPAEVVRGAAELVARVLADARLEPGQPPGGALGPAALRQVLGLPEQVALHVDDDADLGALGEWTWGAARDRADVVYLEVAAGVGAGLVLGGRLHRGAGGTAGEVGHLVVDPAGPPCGCGSRGCLEALVGAPALVAAAAAAGAARPTAADVVTAARGGDPRCRDVLAAASTALGAAVGGLCNVLDPELVILGGELAAAEELVLGPLRAALERGAVRAAADDADVVLGTLGPRATVLGAVTLALHNVLAVERRVP